MKFSSRAFRFLCATVGLGAAATAFATTTTVTSMSALQTAINGALPGDTIIVQNGTYSTSSNINIARQGTAAAPILITAQTIGGVTITGSGSIRFSSPAAWVTVRGFVLKHAQSINIPFGTSHCRLTRNVVQLTIPAGSDVSYVNISGDDIEIDRNDMGNKSTLGEMLDIAGSGTQVAQRLWVHHNYFHDFTSPGGNGAETVRWGLSGLSLSNGYGICEYNLFARCNGENESISNKSSANTYRYNTFIDMPGGQLSQRHGNDNLFYGNYFKNSDGLRIYGDGNMVFSNYLEGNTDGINIGNGDGEVEAGADLTSHDKPDNTIIAFNTLINNARQYFMNGRTGGLGAINTTFVNNIIVGGPTAASISSTGPYTGAVWGGNIIWNTTPGNMPAGTYTIVDPLLAADSAGVFHITEGSPAIGASIGNFPDFVFDQDGQLRDSFKDIGADEFSAGQITAHLLTPADVGPSSSSDEPPPAPALTFEAENLAFANTGASTTVSTETAATGGSFASNSKYVSLNADGIPAPPNGEFIDFTLPNVPRGTYDLLMRYKSNSTSRGIARISVDNVVLGDDLNEMNASAFREPTIGTVKLAAGNHVIRLTVVGRSATATSYAVNADRFVLVPDSTEPVIAGLPDLTREASGPAGAVATYSGLAFDDKDGSVPVTFAPVSGSVFPLGTSTVTATATDFTGNVATSTFKVTVVDTTAPTLTLPANITVEATGPEGATAAFTASAYDLVSGDLPVDLSHASGSTFPLGTTTVLAAAQDAAGNRRTGTFTVTVVDTTPPTLTLPANLVVEATSAAGATATFTAIAHDIVSGDVAVSFDHASGSTFAIGVTTVTASAQDGAGNSVTGTFTVTVVDTSAPVFQSLTASPDTLWLPNHHMNPVTITANVRDAVDASPRTRIIGVASNEPVNGLGDGNTAPDWEITGDLTLNLRAERSGTGTGRIYTITVQSTDSTGNTSTKTVTVAVPHDQGK
jgi:poly(beta-D-mannuronate) lyase